MLRFASYKAVQPPLGLLTVAAMLPREWSKKLVNLNFETLRDDDITRADYVFVSAIVGQHESAREVIARCNALRVKVVAGGPLFTTSHASFPGVDHFVLGEAEVTLPRFLADIARGKAERLYVSDERPDIRHTPIPLWSLVNMPDYGLAAVQYSRGCPFDCEFCDIVVLNGHTPRTKSTAQVISELDEIYARGWRGMVFFVDDNFIGNKKGIKTELLPAIIQWSKQRDYPFSFYTQISINVSDDDELIRLMAEAGFRILFIGIESPNMASLAGCNKNQNTGRDLAAGIRKLHQAGFEVQGGFIVGFDHDPGSIFQEQIDFIQRTGILIALVSLLSALPQTKLYYRLAGENRLVSEFLGTGDRFYLNYVPVMDRATLLRGYARVLGAIYSPAFFYKRVGTFFQAYRPRGARKARGGLHRLIWLAFFFKGSLGKLLLLGVREEGRLHFWRLFIPTAIKHPENLPALMGYGLYGRHFRRHAARVKKEVEAQLAG